MKLKVLIQYFAKAFGKLKDKEKDEFWDYLFYNYDVPSSKNPPPSHKPRGKRLFFDFKIGPVQLKEKLIMEKTINNLQKVLITVTPDEPLASPPTWTVTSGDATVVVSTDGLSAFLVSGTAAADSVILIEAEGDKMPGVDHLSATVTLHVTQAEATTLTLTAGEPVLK